MDVRGEKDVLEALLAAGHQPAVSRFEEESATAWSSAELLGVEVQRIVKSLVFAAGDEPVLALVSGDRRADTKAIAAQLGVKKVRFADPEKVLEWSGFPVGAVPPVGHRRPMKILMDDKLPRQGAIYPAAGEINNAFETTFDELVKITGAKVCAISR